MIDLTGKHIFILGGSRGIGAAAARMAARAGAFVSISYRENRSAAQRLVEEISSEGAQILALRVDVSDDGSVLDGVEEASIHQGPLKGMVISAGIFEGCPLEQMTTEFWDRTMETNVRGTFFAVQAAAKSMRAAGGGGSIVIYTSTAGQRGSAEYSAYAASKGAQIMFMRSMAKELAPDGIRVNCIAPAWTDTEMAAASLDALGRDEVASTFPLGRIGLPEDVAGPTCFLLSDLSGFITGSTITVDGGMDMRG